MKLALKSIIIAGVITIAFQSCSRKKDNFVSRNYHALNTKYNTLFNGYQALEKGRDELNNSYEDNYWELLPIERMQISEDIFLPSESKNENFSRAEEKAVKAIQKHGMNINGKEKNPQIDEAYLLLGKARYFDQRFIPALEAFNYILYKYPTSDKINQAKIWREKTNIRLENDEVAIDNLKRLLEQEELEQQDLADATSMLAQAYINTKYLDSALTQIKVAAKNTKKDFEKGRFNIIKGQLYNKLNYKDSANMAFDKVIKLNRKIPRKYLMAAHIEKAKNFDYKNGDKLAFSELLTDLEEDRENRPFLDKIFFQKAQYFQNTNNDSLAIVYYNKSLRKGSRDKQLTANTYTILGDYYFDNSEYKTAGAYFDSTMTNLRTNSKPFRVMKRKRENLDDVILYEGIATTNDSILRLVNMSEPERLSYFTKYTDSLKQEMALLAEKKEIKSRNKGLNQDKNTTPFVKNRSNPGAASTFYFYNPTTVAYGKQEFEQIYGDRKNNDNWRWSSLKSNGFKSNNIANNAIVSNDSLETLQPDYYISKIPKDAVVIDSLVTDRNYAYYQLGLIYKEKFKEYKLSKTKFVNLLDSNPEEKLILPSKYNLYKINELLNEGSQMAFYKEDIIKNYPDSRYAKILLNPDAANITDTESPEYLYAQTFKLLDEQKFEEVIEKSDQYSANFSDEPIQPKFELLKATAIGRLDGYAAYKQALDNVALEFANSPEGIQAKTRSNQLVQLNDTTFVNNEASKNYKAIYVFNASELNQIDDFTKRLTEAIEKANYRELTVSKDLYDRNTWFVVVHGFKNIQNPKGLTDLFGQLKSTKPFKIKRQPIAVSSENYQKIQIYKSLNSYLNLK